MPHLTDTGLKETSMWSSSVYIRETEEGKKGKEFTLHQHKKELVLPKGQTASKRLLAAKMQDLTNPRLPQNLTKLMSPSLQKGVKSAWSSCYLPTH